MDNKTKGVVSLPAEAGSDANLRFTMECLEQLETKYGPDYFDTVITGLSNARVGIYRECIKVAGNNVTGEFPFDQPLADLQGLILDAIFYAVYGRSYTEQRALDEEKMRQMMDEAGNNPMAAAELFSQMSGSQPTKQD